MCRVVLSQPDLPRRGTSAACPLFQKQGGYSPHRGNTPSQRLKESPHPRMKLVLPQSLSASATPSLRNLRDQVVQIRPQRGVRPFEFVSPAGMRTSRSHGCVHQNIRRWRRIVTSAISRERYIATCLAVDERRLSIRRPQLSQLHSKMTGHAFWRSRSLTVGPEPQPDTCRGQRREIGPVDRDCLNRRTRARRSAGDCGPAGGRSRPLSPRAG